MKKPSAGFGGRFFVVRGVNDIIICMIRVNTSFCFLITTLGLMCFFLFFGEKASAYEPTGHAEIEIPNDGIIFVLEYAFGHESHKLHMPLRAQNTTDTEEDLLSFSVVDEDGNSAKGKAVGIVLSRSALQDMKYVTPLGIKSRFTLLVVFAPQADEMDTKFRLQVNHLPFSFDGEQKLELNPSELEDYTTDFAKL